MEWALAISGTLFYGAGAIGFSIATEQHAHMKTGRWICTAIWPLTLFAAATAYATEKLDIKL